MNAIFQSTISHKISFKGIGLHTGKTSNISILPAKEDEGVVFKRIDLKKNNLVEAILATLVLQNYVPL